MAVAAVVILALLSIPFIVKDVSHEVSTSSGQDAQDGGAIEQDKDSDSSQEVAASEGPVSYCLQGDWDECVGWNDGKGHEYCRGFKLMWPALEFSIHPITWGSKDPESEWENSCEESDIGSGKREIDGVECYWREHYAETLVDLDMDTDTNTANVDTAEAEWSYDLWIPTQPPIYMSIQTTNLYRLNESNKKDANELLKTTKETRDQIVDSIRIDK